MSRIGNLTRLIHTLAICDDHTYIHTKLCGIKQQQYYIVRCNQAQTISDERFPMKTLSEIARISNRILVENRSSETSDKKLPISDSARHGLFLPIGNRQFPIGKKDSVRNGLRYFVYCLAQPCKYSGSVLNLKVHPQRLIEVTIITSENAAGELNPFEMKMFSATCRPRKICFQLPLGLGKAKRVNSTPLRSRCFLQRLPNQRTPTQPNQRPVYFCATVPAANQH